MTLLSPTVLTTIFILPIYFLSGSFAESDSIKPNITKSSVYAVAGKDFNITCETFIPSTHVIWQNQNVYIKQSMINCSGTDAINGNKNRADLYRYFCDSNTSFTLSIPANRITEEHKSDWSCTSQQRSETVIIYVYHAAFEDPQITGYKSLQDLREGQHIILTCTVAGGFPLTSLHWTCDDTLMAAINQSTEDVAKIVLPLQINRTLHKQQCVCNGTSPANYSRTSNITLIVHYPPTVTLISHEENFINRTSYMLFCQVDNGNPRSYTILWSHAFGNITVRSNKDLKNLQLNNGHNLTLTVTSYIESGIYTCSVQNNVTDLNGNLLQNKSLSIGRNFSAAFFAPKSFRAVFGKPVVVHIPFYCNPAIYKKNDITWFNKDKGIQLTDQTKDFSFDLLPYKLQIPFFKASINVNGQVAVMKIHVARNTTMGNYVLEVRNREDMYKLFDFKIEVNEPATNDSVIDRADGPENQDIVLPVVIVCSVGGSSFILLFLFRLRIYTEGKGKDKNQRQENNFTDSTEIIGSSTSITADKYEPNVKKPSANIKRTFGATVESSQQESKKQTEPVYTEVNKIKTQIVVEKNKPRGNQELAQDAQICTENDPFPSFTDDKKANTNLKKSDREPGISVESKYQQKAVIQKGKKPEQVNIELNNAKDSKDEKETVEDKTNVEKDLMMAENNKMLDEKQIDKSDVRGRNDLEPNEEDKKDSMIYVDPDFSKNSCNDLFIHSKGNGVEYAEIKL